MSKGNFAMASKSGCQKLCKSTKGLSRKIWTLTKNLSTIKHTLLCRDIKICRVLCTFRKTWAKQCCLGTTTMFLWQEVHYYMVYIAYHTELKLQICSYAQKRRICRENSKYAHDESFCGQFCLRRKAANFCHPAKG